MRRSTRSAVSPPPQRSSSSISLADFDPDVRGIFAQPCRLVAQTGDRVRRHVPDFLLLLRSGAVRVVNVKPMDRLRDPEIAEALAWPGKLVEVPCVRYGSFLGSVPSCPGRYGAPVPSRRERPQESDN